MLEVVDNYRVIVLFIILKREEMIFSKFLRSYILKLKGEKCYIERYEFFRILEILWVYVIYRYYF